MTADDIDVKLSEMSHSRHLVTVLCN